MRLGRPAALGTAGPQTEVGLEGQADMSGGDPVWLTRGRVPSLDGLRGASILVVLWNHTAYHFAAGWPAWTRQLGDVGSIGVDVFFVISGFLITLLLVRESRARGTVSLRAFYVRRAFRIVPAYVAYVGIVGTVLAFTSYRLHATMWLRLATFTTSLVGSESWYVGHTWSLSVEEHFYLVWPVVFVVLPKRWLLPACVAYSVLAVPLRIAVARVAHVSDTPFFSPVRADTIAVGCGLALLATSPWRARVRAGPRASALLAAAGLVGLAVSYAFRDDDRTRLGVLYHQGGYRFCCQWCIAAVVWAAVHQPRSPLGRVLNGRPLTTVGVLSYGLYLWQQPFLGPLRPFWAFRLPWNLPVIAALACGSYYLVEQPFLRLKSRFEPTPEAARRSEAEADRLVVLPSAAGPP